MELSVCIITKNERENLEKCLQALKKYPFEILVTDTGSTDGSLETAARYADRLCRFQWCDDFAKARNYAASQAGNDTILMIDSDEFLRSLDLSELQKHLAEKGDSVGRIRRRNIFGQGDQVRQDQEYISRLYDRRLFYYEGMVHEQLASFDKKAVSLYETSILVDHTGYRLDGQEREQKADRNIRLLSLMLEKEGDDPYVLYQLGKSYFLKKDYEKACLYFARVLEFDLDPGLEYLADCVQTYGYALLNSGRTGEALAYQSLYPVFGHSADFQFLMGLIYMNNSMFEEAIREFQRASTQAQARVEGTNGFLALYNIGVIYECLGQKDEAASYYRKCGSYQPAKNRLQSLS